MQGCCVCGGTGWCLWSLSASGHTCLSGPLMSGVCVCVCSFALSEIFIFKPKCSLCIYYSTVFKPLLSYPHLSQGRPPPATLLSSPLIITTLVHFLFLLNSSSSLILIQFAFTHPNDFRCSFFFLCQFPFHISQ